MSLYIFLRKEVIQPHLPIRLPCYDFTPVIGLTLGSALLAVRQPTSGTPNSRGVTGGVYKARERIHRGVLIRDSRKPTKCWLPRSPGAALTTAPLALS